MRRSLIGLHETAAIVLRKYHQSHLTRMRTLALLGLLCSMSPFDSTMAWAQLIRAPTYEGSDGVSKTFLLIDSKWGYISPFNVALASRLRECKDPSAMTEDVRDLPELLELSPNRFGEAATTALITLRKCRSLPATNGDSEKQVSDLDWQDLLPNTALPSIYMRARAIAFRGAGRTSDYDGITLAAPPFSLGPEVASPSTPAATTSVTLTPPVSTPSMPVLTWGPALAQTTEGCYVQRILISYSQTSGGAKRLDAIFSDDSDAAGDRNKNLKDLLLSPCSSANSAPLAAALQEAEERGVLKGFFADLATDPILRSTYDDAYLGDTGPWTLRLNSFYKLYQDAGYTPTEIDFAYFLDLLRGVIPKKKIDATLLKRFRSEGKLSPAKRRHLLFDLLSFRVVEQKNFLLGRAVSYWIDEDGEKGLPPDEKTAWLAHSRVRASDVGLSDQTSYYPCEILKSLERCKDR